MCKPITVWKWLPATSAVVLIITAPVSATPIVQYTFESPIFSNTETTPILNASPNIDPTGGAFKASFTDATTPGVANFAITGVFLANGLIQGQNLFEDLNVPIDPLALAFNMPVDQLIVSFGLNDDVAGGSLQLITSTGATITQVSSLQLGGLEFPGGTLSFSTVTPFTSATLRAFTASGSPTQFAIDNLQLDVAQATSTAVPEPATITLIGFGLAAGLRHRRRQPGR